MKRNDGLELKIIRVALPLLKIGRASCRERVSHQV